LFQGILDWATQTSRIWLHRCTSHFSLIGLHRFHAFGVFNTLRIFSLIGLLGNAHLASSIYLRPSHLLLNWFRFRSLGIFNFSPLRFRHTAFSQHLWFQALGIESLQVFGFFQTTARTYIYIHIFVHTSCAWIWAPTLQPHARISGIGHWIISCIWLSHKPLISGIGQNIISCIWLSHKPLHGTTGELWLINVYIGGNVLLLWKAMVRTAMEMQP